MNSALISRDGGTRVVFHRTGDRWTHTLEGIVNGNWRESWSSREGNAGDAWPASPALQSLEKSVLPDGREVLLLVGMAGTSHWSASVEWGASPGEFVFDIACRMSKLPDEPARLGSWYEKAIGGPRLEFAPLADVNDTVIRAEESAAQITPLQWPKRLPGTARWRYRVTCP